MLVPVRTNLKYTLESQARTGWSPIFNFEEEDLDYYADMLESLVEGTESACRIVEHFEDPEMGWIENIIIEHYCHSRSEDQTDTSWKEDGF